MVAIKEMSMPKYCNDCDFVVDSMGYCERANEQIPNYDFFSETNEKPDFCPLIEIEERKVGKWIELEDFDCSDKGEYLVKCSICGSCNGYNKSNYCHNCGAEMEGNNEIN